MAKVHLEVQEHSNHMITGKDVKEIVNDVLEEAESFLDEIDAAEQKQQQAIAQAVAQIEQHKLTRIQHTINQL